ncbi:chromate efflux transporter [Thalassovita taeanensis]|uniref:Chromate transporter n=1 Tax=Thalassovita taeanensis TaxID=657014 RepID=A0A1H9J9N3_9RHOB|nr:chromate efflux transporter [Thalassovita taeanensis]SEQ83594.1 chromate transporter [Thalassovita taeanensis]
MIAPTYADLFRVFGRIGLLSFGGPAAQIALMHRELVEERPWLSEENFLSALSFCMLLPGPEAMQLATYAGWRQRGPLGGLIAGGLFVLPGAILVAALALAYAQFGQLPMVQAVFVGVQAAVVIIVLQALQKISKKSLTGRDSYAIAALSFLAIFILHLPFPALIFVAALWGYATSAPIHLAATPKKMPQFPTRTVLLWLVLWLAPMAVLALSGQTFLAGVALFFAKLAVVTFGGAYAVLAYMTQAVVDDYGWLTLPQMIDALGLAETTPGPLILVTQFVGMLAGHIQGGVPLALIAGGLTLWMTFVPCFLWIFTGAPYIEHLSSQPRLSGALRAITAAVTGVILNLSLWFALHILFGTVTQTRFAPLPDWSSFNPTAFALTCLAAALLLILRVGMLPTLALMALAGAAATVL